MAAPAVVGMALAGVIRHGAGIGPFAVRHAGFVGGLLFVTAILFAVALPILMRSRFADRQRGKASVPENDLLQFETRLIMVALVPLYVGLAAYLLRIAPFHFGGTMLAALYGAYYHYPSNRRVAFERRIFRAGKDRS